MDQQRQLDNHERRIERVETWCVNISEDIGTIKGTAGTTKLLVKVIIILCVLIAGLVGVKLFVPGF